MCALANGNPVKCLPRPKRKKIDPLIYELLLEKLRTCIKRVHLLIACFIDLGQSKSLYLAGKPEIKRPFQCSWRLNYGVSRETVRVVSNVTTPALAPLQTTD